VSSSSVFRWFCVAALLLSVAWKAAASFSFALESYSQNELINFLNRNHFVVSEEEVDGISIIQAAADSCRLQIANLYPDGSNRDMVRGLFGDADHFFVVFRGRVYAQQPIFWTSISAIWSKRLYELGLTKSVPAVIAVATNTSCDVERVPWSELREVF
jgi:hypothetical protein